MVWIVAIALVSTVLPISTFVLGLERVGASTASIVSTVEPVITVGLAVALFGDALGAPQLVGGALVLAAVIALQLRGGAVAAVSVVDHGAAAAPAACTTAGPSARQPA